MSENQKFCVRARSAKNAGKPYLAKPGGLFLIRTRWWDCSFCYKWWRDILCRCYIYTDSTYSITLLTFLCPFCAHGPALIGDCLAGWKAVIYNKGACTRLVCFPYAFGMYG